MKHVQDVVFTSISLIFFVVLTSTGGAAIDAGIGALEADQESIRFQAIDVLVETGDEHLAAWQLAFHANVPGVQIVGIEGGEHPAFVDPPFYDPKAMMRDQVILADYSTIPAAQLPSGRLRISTIHVSITGDVVPDYIAELTAAANADGDDISATVHINLRDSS